MEPDEDHGKDSLFDTNLDPLAGSSTITLQSDITTYRFEHGRRYHAYQDGKYLFTNDEQELERMDIEHHNQRLQMDGRLFLCPLVDEPREILELGTGTGIWCIEMADMFPTAQVIGTDLSPVQPSWVPPNCRFEIDDFEQPWTFGSNRFDMIQHRFLIGSVTSYPELYRRAFQALKPGGSIHCVEMELDLFCDDGTLPEDAASRQWARLMHEAFGKMSRIFPKAEQFVQMMEEAGFEDVRLRVFQRPLNDWPKDPRMKEIGRYCCLNWLQGLEAFSLAPFTRNLGWSPDEVKVLLAKVRKESITRRIHSYHKGLVCWGVKPLVPPG